VDAIKLTTTFQLISSLNKKQKTVFDLIYQSGYMPTNRIYNFEYVDIDWLDSIVAQYEFEQSGSGKLIPIHTE
jgi:hypothetical protein